MLLCFVAALCCALICAALRPPAAPCTTSSLGISFSDDKLLQTRIFSYSDTQRYRLGVNYQMLPGEAASVSVREGV